MLLRRFCDDDGLLHYFEKIVTAARSGHTPQLSPTEKATWDLFFFYQWKRGPDSLKKSNTLENFEASFKSAVEEYERTYRPLTTEEQASLKDERNLERIRQNAKVRAIVDPGQSVLTVMDQKGIAIAIVSDPKKSFVIGSLPLVKLTSPGRTHLADPAVEMWFPIASDVAVSPAFMRGEEKLVPMQANHVRRINGWICSQSTTTAARSKALMLSLISRR